MSIECGDYEEASTLLDVLIGRLVDELQSTIDEYQDEVEVVDGRLEWAEDADEEVDEEEAGEDSSDDEDDDDEPYETATHMMPRLLVDKAVLAARQKQFNYSEELFENALELDCADPYVVLTAIEEYFEPHEQWDQIIFYFRQLPLIDPNREFVNEARSLRQSILETIMDSEASNQQIYDLYHLSDDSNLEYYGRNEDLELLPDTDYFGRDVHTHSDVNDGFDRFGYNHRLFTDPAATQFTVGEPAKRGIESLSAAEFYPGIPNSLREDYMDLNWFEVPVMKEWMKEIPTGGASVDWESMRDKNGNLKIAQDQVLTKEGKLKVTLENVQKLHDLLEEEYEGVGDLASEPEHADDAKSQSILIREYKTNPVERNRWHQLEEDIEYPVDKQDFAFMSLLNESLKQFKEGEEEEEEEGNQNEEEGETK